MKNEEVEQTMYNFLKFAIRELEILTAELQNMSDNLEDKERYMNNLNLLNKLKKQIKEYEN